VNICLAQFSVHAQNEENEKKMREMDVSVFGNKTFLNKAIVIDEINFM
jgi:hypothetical protein